MALLVLESEVVCDSLGLNTSLIQVVKPFLSILLMQVMYSNGSEFMVFTLE